MIIGLWLLVGLVSTVGCVLWNTRGSDWNNVQRALLLCIAIPFAIAGPIVTLLILGELLARRTKRGSDSMGEAG